MAACSPSNGNHGEFVWRVMTQQTIRQRCRNVAVFVFLWVLQISRTDGYSIYVFMYSSLLAKEEEKPAHQRKIQALLRSEIRLPTIHELSHWHTGDMSVRDNSNLSPIN